VFDPFRSRFRSKIDKLSVAQIAITARFEAALRFCPEASHRHSTENIQPAVIIKIEQPESATHGFDQVAIGGKTLNCRHVMPASAVDIRKYGLRTCIGSNQCGSKALTNCGS